MVLPGRRQMALAALLVLPLAARASPSGPVERVMLDAGFTATEVQLFIHNLQTAAGSGAELRRFKRKLLLSDVTDFSREIQTRTPLGGLVGLRYRIFTHDPRLCVWISRGILQTGWWERAISVTMLRLLETKYRAYNRHMCDNSSKRKKRIFMDIGANIGWFTFLWAAHGVDVISVEAMEYNQAVQAKTLDANAALRRHVRPYKKLLGSAAQANQTKCIRYHETKGYRNRGNGAIYDDDGHDIDCDRVATLADLEVYDPASEHVYAMKIDVEGFEVHVLEGMGLAGDALPCVIWIEIVGAKRKGQKEFDQRGRGGTVRDWLASNNYRLHPEFNSRGGKDDYVYLRQAPACDRSVDA